MELPVQGFGSSSGRTQHLATTSVEVHKRAMGLTNHTHRRSTVARAITVLLIVTFLLPSLDAGARRRKPKKKRSSKRPTLLIVTSTTERADVELDGQFVGKTPIEDGLPIGPGPHTIRVSKRGWTEHNDTFEATQGETIDLEIDLLPVAGIVRIRTPSPGATVEVNGKVVGVTPFDQDIPVGRASIRVRQSGFHDVIKDIDIQLGKFYDLEMPLEALPVVVRPAADKVPVTDKWWFWTAIGTAVAGGAWAVAAIIGAEETLTPPEPHTTILIP
jgi:hypothetical protein